MSGETTDRPTSVSSVSSVSSISLVEIKAETRLVLKAFIRQNLSIPLEERPGRVGGTYKDPQKYSASWKLLKKEKDSRNSQDEDDGSADERTSTIKKLIKRIPTPIRRPTKDGDPAQSSNGTLERDGRLNGVSPAVQLIRDQLEGDLLSPSSTSSEDDGGKEQKKVKKKKKKLRKQISDFFRIKSKDKKEDKEKEDGRPQRPTSLEIPQVPEPVKPPISPTHPPEFYEEVAERLDKLAQRSHSIKRPSPRPMPSPPKPAPSDKPPPEADKEAVLQKLIQVLSMEGDAINKKIQSDHFLRSSLTRLSYPSFAKLLDTFASSEVATPPPMPAPEASPTLRRVAVTMEVSRRVVTATGTQRMQGYAERYMENFAPWVKKQGGWENIVVLEESVELEYD